MKFEVKDEYIELSLKVLDIVESVVHKKMIVADGYVVCNGEVELQIRAK